MTKKELIELLRKSFAKNLPASAAKADGPAADGGNAAPNQAEDDSLDKQILDKLNALAEAVAKLLEDEQSEEGQADDESADGEADKDGAAQPAPKEDAQEHECPKCGYAGQMKAKKPEKDPKDDQAGEMSEEEVEKQLSEIDSQLVELDEQANG